MEKRIAAIVSWLVLSLSLASPSSLEAQDVKMLEPRDEVMMMFNARSVPAVPNRFSILIVSDGFAAAEIAQFESQVVRFRELLLGTEPFRSSRERIDVRSHYQPQSLGCRVTHNSHRFLMDCDDSAALNAAFSSGLPFDELLVIFNHPQPAGLAWLDRERESYRTNPQMSYGMATNSAETPMILLHELGHSGFRLADEYFLTGDGRDGIDFGSANCVAACSFLAAHSNSCRQGCGFNSRFFAPEEASTMRDYRLAWFNQAGLEGAGGIRERLAFFTGSSPSILPRTPQGFRAQVSGTTADLSWGVVGTALYELEAGSAPGRSDLGSLLVSGTSYRAQGLPYGRYYVRLRAIRGGIRSAPTLDVPLVVEAPCSPPERITELRSTVEGRQVTVSWDPVARAEEYLVQAYYNGRLLVQSLVTRSNVLSAVVQPGSYFVYVFPQNSCGRVGGPMVILVVR